MSKKYSYEGSVVEVGEEQTFGNFTKRQIVILEGGDTKYPSEIAFEASGDKCSELDGFVKGDTVKIEFFLNGRRWHNEKKNCDQFFTTLKIADIQRTGVNATKVAVPSTEKAASSAPDTVDDDMPF